MLNRRVLLTSTFGDVALATLGQTTRLASGADLAVKEDVPWLAEIQTPPTKMPADTPTLAPLCKEQDGTPITNKEVWLRRRVDLLARWKEFLGPMPAERKAVPKLEVVEEDRPDGTIRQLVKYKGAGKVSAAVCFQETNVMRALGTTLRVNATSPEH